MNPSAFSRHYPFAAYAACRAHWDATPRDEKGGIAFSSDAYEAWSDAQQAHHRAMSEPVLDFLVEKALAKRIPKVAFASGRGHAFSDIWNEVVSGTVDRGNTEYVTRPIVAALMTSARLSASGSGDLRADYDQMCATVDAGNFDWFDLDTRSKCFVTGEELCVEMRGWAPRLGVFDYKNRSEPFTLVEGELPAPSVAHNIIDAPSGELLIGDWIRIDAFTELVTARDAHDSLASQAGRLRRVKTFAEQFGFMSVFAGNTSPSIVARDGHLVFARVHEESGNLKGDLVGSVCTDLWAVTVIDRQVLTGLLAGVLGQEAAEREVAAAVAPQQSRELVTVKVRPGKLHIYSTGPETGMSGFTSPDVDMTSVEQVFAVLSESEMKWTPKAKAGAKAEVKAEAEPTPRPVKRPRMR